MTYTEGDYYAADYDHQKKTYLQAISAAMVGKSIVSHSSKTGKFVLSDGTVVRFDKSNAACCAGLDMIAMRGSGNNIITAITMGDNELTGVSYEQYENSNFNAWLTVLTEAGEEINIVEADGNVGTGYYMTGFSLGVTITKPDHHTKTV